MATIQIIDINIRLNRKGLQTKDSNNQWVNVKIKKESKNS